MSGKDLTRSETEWLEYHDDKAVEGDEHYTPKEHLADVSKALTSWIVRFSKFKYVGKDGEEKPYGPVHCSKDDAEEFWVKSHHLVI